MEPAARATSTTKLNPNELEEILKWIDGFALSRSSKKLSRDFSDAVLLAEILKYELPKVVDLHNYTGCNAIQGKIDNWNILNRKVLKKLHVHLTKEEMEMLARAETSLIEQVLFTVMSKVKLVQFNENQRLKAENENPTYSSDIMTITVTKQVGDHVERIPQQMIPYSIHEELLAKYEQQEMVVKELEENIHDLRNGLESKKQIIKDLEARLEKRLKRSNNTLSINSIKESIANLF